jgi:asparagine synthase (glutamine-hydrolysing)
VETRVPFLDLALVRLAMRLPIELKLRDGQDKWILRHAFADILPEYVRQRPKNPLSHSSGPATSLPSRASKTRLSLSARSGV